MKKDLLVIERNTRDTLAGRLSAEGYSVCRAETCTAALEALKLHKITHAIILNAISMRTNGARTCASLKQAAPGPSNIDLLRSREAGTGRRTAPSRKYNQEACQ